MFPRILIPAWMLLCALIAARPAHSQTVDTEPPVIIQVEPATNAVVATLVTIEVHFSEAVTNVGAADLLINGTAAVDFEQIAPDNYVFEFPQPPTGTVQVAWAANHGITDIADARNPFGGGSWTLQLNPAAFLPRLVISEFMASNTDKGLHDEDGDNSDWIEIFNAGLATVSLEGWYLTDETNNLTKWRFPAVDLLTNSYLVVFASEKNRTTNLAKLHTNFKLEKSGEYLALVQPDGRTIASQFAPFYPRQEDLVSYGRDTADLNIVGFFPRPTPGTANSIGGAGFGPAVHFSRPGGTFLNPFEVVLSVPTTNAEIRYTLDGTLPTNAANGTFPTNVFLYTNAIPVTNSIRIRARAYQPGLLPGPPRSEHYLWLSNNLQNFTTDLPVIILHTYSIGAVNATTDRFVNFSLYEPKGGVTSLTNAPDLTERARFKRRGSSTEGITKGSYAVEFWDDFNNDKQVELLGMPADADWVLYAPNNFEPVLIHNPFIFELSNQVGRYAARTRFVEVYLNTTVNGIVQSNNWQGIYVLMEKLKRSPDRVDIDELEPEHVNVPEVTGGYFLKIDRTDPNDSPFSGAGQSINYIDPKGPEIRLVQRDPQEKYIAAYFTAFNSALNGTNWTNAVGYANFIDTDSWIDHHILNVLAFNVDALRLSGYFYKPRRGKITMGPIWDFDRALNSTDGRDSAPRVWRSASGDLGTDFFNYPWWSRLFRDPNFWQKWIDRYQDLRESVFSLTNMFALIDKQTGEVRAAQPRERAKWGWVPRGGSYQGEINLMKTWLSNRVDFMDTNFLVRPTISRPGGRITPGAQVELSLSKVRTNAIIYYTLDGTDPRDNGGAVSSNALVYSQPIILNANARLVARTFDSTHRNLTGANRPPISSPWSGPVAATYWIEIPKLAITELMFHPPEPPAGSTNDADSYEFIELKNIGTTPINLKGFRLSGGVDFTFPDAPVATVAPGGYVVVVKDKAAFTARYGASIPVAGEYGPWTNPLSTNQVPVDNLNNAGERLILEGPMKEPILDFVYRDRWHPSADGLGFSLVVADENAPRHVWGQRGNWRISSAVLGNPGAADSGTPSVPPIVINEVIPNTVAPERDALELFNPTSAEVDVSGWYLSDDFAEPKKFKIPAGRKIAAGGTLAFTEAEFNVGATGFAFNADGDEVYLFSADASGNLTGYAHGFQFGPTALRQALGRFVTATGSDRLVTLSSGTPGAANSPIQIGPVVINEIMYNPPMLGTTNRINNEIDEYIELRNITSQPAPLFDPNYPTNTWRLDGGVGFEFPGNVTIPANGFLLVVNFNPALELGQLANFRAKYNISESVPIFGPYSGQLENLGERIELKKPNPPKTTLSPDQGTVPYVLVEEVDYSPSAPWPPQADGTGLSLQRLNSSAFADDPLNWEAAATTPGKENARTEADTDGDGLSDQWETTFNLDPRVATGPNGALGDVDTDGVNNLHEFISGTDPRNAGSFLKVEAAKDGAGIKLRFRAQAGKSYSIFYRDNFGTGGWYKLADQPALSASADVEVVDPEATSASKRFYKLATPSLQ